ncbi:MAG: ABC transporter permease [Oscillospiraceae bacterium]|nr:ABC transporter permease [Oscillospiraceae bacterium]
MRVSEQFRSVIYSIMANKFRVFLTSLGIVIGTFTIIMVVGIGKASSDAVSEQYKRLSVETITISRANMRMNFGGGGIGISLSQLTKDQALAMEDELEHVKSVGVSVNTSSPVAYGLISENVTVQGINEAYAEITRLNILHGEFFTDEDGARRDKLVVLGYNVATLLFGEDIEDAIGEKVLIKGLSFTVVGVLERIGGTGGIAATSMASSSQSDDMVFIPYDVAVRYTSGSGAVSSGGAVRIASAIGGGGAGIVALANDISSVKAAITEIEDYIADIIGDYTTYNVTDAGSTLSSALETSNTMSTLLISVAAIVLIVSGIGIMNVLMVAVKERTREIGILKSIGAAKYVILLEFLLEAVFISVFGGALGVALSVYVPNVLDYMGIDYSPSVNGLLLGFGFSVITGIFFGYYPAYKASKLRPIEALSAE